MRSRTRVWILLVFPLFLYANALTNDFQYDDFHTIVQNSHLHAASLGEALYKIPDFFATGEYYSAETHRIRHYRPLLYSTYVINYALTGPSPSGFRWVNLLLHLGCVILVYRLGCLLLPRPGAAFPAALIFGAHPLFSEAVNYISARSSLLVAFFYLLAFLKFIQYRLGSPDAPQRRWTLLLFFLSAGAALLSKEVALTLPLLMIAYDHCLTPALSRGRSLRFVLPYIPFIFLVPLVLLKIDFLNTFQSIYMGGELIRDHLGGLLAQWKGIYWLVGLFLLPLGLSVEHPIHPPVHLLEPDLVAAFLLFALFLIAARLVIRAHPKMAFLSLWIPVTLLPLLLIPLNIPFAEHRAYLPAVGLALGAGASVSWIRTIVTRGSPIASFSWNWKGMGSVALLGVILISYGLLTVQRNTIWKNGVSLWSDAVTVAPNSARAWANLGLAFHAEQQPREALQAFRNALAIHPKNQTAWVGIASLEQQAGNLGPAIQAYQMAISLNPDYYLPYYNLGVAFQKQGDREQAIRHYQQVLRINRHHPRTYLNLGDITLEQGEIRQAIRFYEQALELDSALQEARDHLEIARELLGGKGLEH